MALTKKRRVFVEEYLKCWNATEAARRAEYAHPGQQGHRLLKNVEITDLVQDRIREKMMDADEVLLRLGEQARAEHAEYIRADGSVDLERLLKDGKGHLVKATKWDRQGNLVIEFYDAQSALVHIGRVHKLFTDRHEVEMILPDPKELTPEQCERLLAGEDIKAVLGIEDGRHNDSI